MALTPRQLRTMAAKERETARLATVRAELYERTADELERLSTVNDSASVNGNDMQATTSSNLKRSAAANAMDKPFLRACNAAGYSQARLAAELGVTPAALASYTSHRRIPRARAEQIERLIGYAATAANWPNGIAEEHGNRGLKRHL